MKSDGRVRLPIRRPARVGYGPRQAHDVDDRFGPDPFAIAVGIATHRVIAQLAPLRDMSQRDLRDALWSLAGSALAEAIAEDGRISRRYRAARLSVTGAAAVYADRFLPPSSWRFLGSELHLGPGARIDLAWESAGFILIDELKTGLARRGPGPTSRQVATYVELARQAYGTAFVGVRLLYLGAASRSQLILPDGRHVPLTATPYGFDTPSDADVA